MPYVFFLFVAVPIIEIAVLIKVGSTLGLFTTIAIVILTALLGTAMLRQQGLATMNQARNRMQSGEMPALELLEGLLLLIGGVLLLTPGFVTDAFGFACLIPPSRRFLARLIGQKARFRVIDGAGRPVADNPAGGSGKVSKPTRSGDSDVLEGEYRRED